jgi:hypothetical protein
MNIDTTDRQATKIASLKSLSLTGTLVLFQCLATAASEPEDGYRVLGGTSGVSVPGVQLLATRKLRLVGGGKCGAETSLGRAAQGA